MAQPTPDHHYSHHSYHPYLNTPILQAQPLTDWDQNAPECLAASHKTNGKHSGSHKTNEEPSSSHKTNERHVGSHNHIKSPHTRTFTPEDGFQKKLAKQTYLTNYLITVSRV